MTPQPSDSPRPASTSLTMTPEIREALVAVGKAEQWAQVPAGTLRILNEAIEASQERASEPAGLDVEALKSAGFEPDFNVCSSCHHHGSNHSLSNVCLECGDRFTSMTEDEKWAWGISQYVRLTASAAAQERP